MSFPVEFPAYMIDKRVISAVRRDNLTYLKAKLADDQYLFKRLYFYEVPSATNNLKKKRQVFCFPLMGYAILYGSLRALEMMLNSAVNPYQKGLIMEESRIDKIERRMQEVNCVTLFWMALQSGLQHSCYRMFALLMDNHVDLSKTFDLRTQQTSNNEVIKHSLSVYGDIIHFLKHQFRDVKAEQSPLLMEMNYYVDILDKMRLNKVDLAGALRDEYTPPNKEAP